MENLDTTRDLQHTLAGWGILGLYIGIMEKKIETTGITRYIGVMYSSRA